MAPGANIALVLAADNSFTNLDIANLFVIENQLGTVVSNSFGSPEVVIADIDPAELTVENGISEIAAALEISQNVSSGDSGDNLAIDTKDGIPAVSVGVPRRKQQHPAANRMGSQPLRNCRTYSQPNLFEG
jgi:subtilase family serine protease